MSPIRLVYRHDAGELAEAHSAFRRKGPKALVERFIGLVLIFLGLVLFFAVQTFAYRLIGTVFALFGAGYLTGLLDLTGLAVRAQFAKEPKLHAEQDVTFDEEHIAYKSEGIDSKIPWTYYNRLFETRRTICLATSGNILSVFPRRAFGNDRIEDFRVLAVSKGLKIFQ